MDAGGDFSGDNRPEPILQSTFRELEPSSSDALAALISLIQASNTVALSAGHTAETTEQAVQIAAAALGHLSQQQGPSRHDLTSALVRGLLPLYLWPWLFK